MSHELCNMSHEQKLQVLRDNLPYCCGIGSHYAVDFQELLSESKPIVDDSPAPETPIALFKTRLQIKKMTTSTVKTMKIKDLSELFELMRTPECTDSSLLSVAEKRSYVMRNVSLLVSAQEVVASAIEDALDLFVKRLPDYKRLFKMLVRLATSTYSPDCCDKFKTFFVIYGLLNFSSHYLNDHAECKRFVWHCRCSFRGEGGISYEPSQPYVNSEPSRYGGTYANSLVISFFKILVKSWTLSVWSEENISKIVKDHPTTTNESFFHCHAMYNNKVYNIKEAEYIQNAKACYIAFVKKQQSRIKHRKLLSYNKNAGTLIATSAQKVGVHEPHVIDAIRSLFPTDVDSLNEVARADILIEKLLERRKTDVEKYNKYVEEYVGLDLGLGEERANYSTIGCRPCPPFPFVPENLLQTDELWNNFQAVHKFTRDLKTKQAARAERVRQAQQQEVDDAAGEQGMDDHEP